jgi:hypothetical protein
VVQAAALSNPGYSVSGFLNHGPTRYVHPPPVGGPCPFIMLKKGGVFVDERNGRIAP